MADIDGRTDADHQHGSEEAVTVNGFVPAWLADGASAAALSLSQAVYSKRAVLAAAYKLSDRCAILVDADGRDRWILYVVARPDRPAGALLPALINELADQSLRDELEREFGAVRTLVVAHALSEGNLLDAASDDAHAGAEPLSAQQRR